MNIRNFVIIAHVDHGKSTLADRLLEVTGTVESRRMRPQYLDQLDLERERGITIKMAPVRMRYSSEGEDYILNLIDTPGHSDFAYEVSRALAAVEGAILLVDATKGIQAQTLSNYRQAKASGLEVVGAVNKIDIAAGRADQAVLDLAGLLEIDPSEIFRISGKTGEGVAELLKAVIRRVPPPQEKDGGGRALIFDSLYDDHKGILAYVRVREGTFRPFENSHLMAADTDVRFKEVGYFLPQLRPAEALGPGEIGYFATGLKEPALVKIGDTVVCGSRGEALPGYRGAAPGGFISFFPHQAPPLSYLKHPLPHF